MAARSVRIVVFTVLVAVAGWLVGVLLPAEAAAATEEPPAECVSAFAQALAPYRVQADAWRDLAVADRPGTVESAPSGVFTVDLVLERDLSLVDDVYGTVVNVMKNRVLFPCWDAADAQARPEAVAACWAVYDGATVRAQARFRKVVGPAVRVHQGAVDAAWGRLLANPDWRAGARAYLDEFQVADAAFWRVWDAAGARYAAATAGSQEALEGCLVGVGGSSVSEG